MEVSVKNELVAFKAEALVVRSESFSANGELGSIKYMECAVVDSLFNFSYLLSSTFSAAFAKLCNSNSA